MGRFASLVIAFLCIAPAMAGADVFKLYGQAEGGGMFGRGLAGTQKDDAFFKKASGGAYGATIGAQFLFLDAHISHHQYINGDGLTTWTQFTTGLNFGFDTGSDEEQKAHEGGYVEIGAGLAFGVGTGAQVDPPLDNSEVTDKGFLLQGGIGFGKHLSSMFDLGVAVPVSWGFFFKSGSGVNETDNQYQSFQLEALVLLRANLRLL